MYYNTTNKTNPELTEYWDKNAKQNDLIHALFKSFPNDSFTPFDIQRMIKESFDRDFPITSIRRAINTLTNDNILEKTLERRLGEYGRANCCWRLCDVVKYLEGYQDKGSL